MKVAGYIVVALAMLLTACSMTANTEESADPGAQAVDLESEFNTLVQKCMQAEGFEWKPPRRPADPPESPDAPTRGLSASTEYFNQTNLPAPLLGRSLPPPEPTPASSRSQIEELSPGEQAAYFTALNGADGCDASANIQMQQLIFPEVSSGLSVDLAELIASDPRIGAHKSIAASCLRDLGHEFVDPISAYEFFRSEVEEIGPPNKENFSSEEVEALTSLQDRELDARTDLSECGWFEALQELEATIVEEKRIDEG